MYKIRTYNQISDIGLSCFPMESYEVGPDVAEPDAFVLRSQKLHDEPVPQGVLAVARAGAGVNNIPVDDYTHRGIVVFNTPGANANAVKELVTAALLLSSRGILNGMNRVQEMTDISDPEVMAKQLEKEKKQFAGSEIAGRTLGVIGLGAIGSMVANMALELGMKVAGFDPALSVEAAWRLSSRVHEVDSIEALVKMSDFVSLHAPSLPATRNIVGKRQLDLLRDGAVFMNNSRGSVLDHDALTEAARAGRFQIALDVSTPEPLPEDHPLRAMPNVHITPHTAGTGAYGYERIGETTADAVESFFGGRPFEGEVDLSRWELYG